MRSELRRRSPGGVAARLAAIFGVAGVIALGLFLVAGRPDPTVQQVAVLATGAMPVPPAEALRQEIDGVGFPDWRRWGWTTTGGRRDEMAGGRDASTVLYARGDDRIAYTVVEGDGYVDLQGSTTDYRFPLGPRGPKVELLSSGATVNGRPLVLVKRHRGERTVVLTGWPSDERMLKDVQLQALRPAL